jgi:hypothetical protein
MAKRQEVLGTSLATGIGWRSVYRRPRGEVPCSIASSAVSSRLDPSLDRGGRHPDQDPRRIADHFVRVLGFKHFDILVPDATHADTPLSIARFYKSLFDACTTSTPNKESRSDMSARY